MAIQTTALFVVLLVLIPLYIVYKPPKLVISYFQRRFPEVLFQVKTTQKIVALTIDDTPSTFTAPILNVLKLNNATATFFVIGGQVEGREYMLQDVVAAGSELGNHAMHDEPSNSLSSAVLEHEIGQVDVFIEQAYHSARQRRSARYFRPGSGIFSRRILDIMRKTGYETILGSIYPHDPFISFWRINAWHILSMLRPGAIIVCHDRRSWTVPMLRKVLPEIKRRGYTVVSVTELLEATGS